MYIRFSPHTLLRVSPLLITLCACQGQQLVKREEVATSVEAANVYVSAYPAVPWANISAKLSPNNNLSITDARTMATQTTQIDISQAVSAIAAGLAVTLPGTSSTSTTSIAKGVTDITSSRTSTTGAVPSASGTPSAALPNGLTLSPTAAPLATGVDGSTVLTAGTGLYQLAQILDNQIANEILPQGYQAYLVTFQINLQPLHRDLAYDAYTDITLMPANWSQAVAASAVNANDTGALPPVKMYPLIITDAMETTNIGRSVEAIRQASLQLSGIVAGAGLNAGLAGGTGTSNSIIGLDKNSVVTAGRVNDHMIRVRLGAENSGSSGLAMVPRSYNVSIVVMARWDPDQPDKSVTGLSVVTNTTIKNDSAQDLPSGPTRTRDAIAGSVASIIGEYSQDLGLDKSHPIGGPCVESSDPAAASGVSTALNLLRVLDRGDYALVGQCLGLSATLDRNQAVAAVKDLTLQRLMASLEELQVDSRSSNFLIALQTFDRSVTSDLPDAAQRVYLADDGNQNATVTLRGGKNLDASQLQASLMLTDRTKILATSISVLGGGSEINIAFPSLAKLGVKDTDLAAKPLFFAINKQTNASYALTKIPTSAAKAQAAANPVQATQNVLVADAATDTAVVNLLIGKTFPANGSLTVAGADIRAAGGSASLTGNGVKISSAGTVAMLTLGNLTPTRTVTVTTMDANSKAVGDPIVLTVDRLSVK